MTAHEFLLLGVFFTVYFAPVKVEYKVALGVLFIILGLVGVSFP